MKEKQYEELLNIKTIGDQSWDETKMCYHPYEPTPYFALDKLFENYNINEEDSIIDFGCGKGRLNFYLNYNFNCNVLGIEMDENFYNQCLENKKEYLQPVIEIEYYEEVILCSGTPDSPWGDAGIFPDEPDNGTW